MSEDKEKKTTHFGTKVVLEEEKQGLVREVFDSVADKYDLMNDLMSLGVHRFWKRFVARLTGLRPGDSALDVAGGTGDIALLMSDRVTDSGRVVVFDINGEMLRVGRAKCLDRGYIKGLDFVQDVFDYRLPGDVQHRLRDGVRVRPQARALTRYRYNRFHLNLPL